MIASIFGRTRILALATLALLALGPALAAQQAAPTPTLSKAEIEALFRARSDSARMHFTAADVGFMSGMIVHHTQALLMADMAPSHGASASVRTLCARIINAQKDEIATMQQWLRDRGQAVPDVRVNGLDIEVSGLAGEMPGMDMSGGQAGGDRGGKGRSAGKKTGDASGAGMSGMDMSGMHHAQAGATPSGGRALMPGMLTPQQMRELDGARGADFDRLFLAGMIQHHSGAITMVSALFATPGAGQDELAFKLANDIQVDQKTEIARMQLMLAALGGVAPAAPAR